MPQIVLSIILSSITWSSCAQFKIGIQTSSGITSNRSTTNYGKHNSQPAYYFNAGGESYFKLSEKLELLGGVTYERIRLVNNVEYSLPGYTEPTHVYEMDYSLNYIRFPIEILFSFKRDGPIIGSGFSISYGLKGKLMQKHTLIDGTPHSTYYLPIKIDGKKTQEMETII